MAVLLYIGTDRFRDEFARRKFALREQRHRGKRETGRRLVISSFFKIRDRSKKFYEKRRGAKEHGGSALSILQLKMLILKVQRR